MRSVRGFEPDDPRVVITATWLKPPQPRFEILDFQA